ncbi:hypothetical protein C4J81_12185 [Deltaproteobacteria bacterium Smac51]|nr:hypothetical protein C4J81_12185 [Deltaproteobacteria bacterium Smac51]
MQHTRDGLTWHTFSILEPYPELRHGYFTRAGGSSGPARDELNLAFADERDPVENVLANIDRARAVLGLPAPAFVRQTHGADISVVMPAHNYHPRSPEEVRYGFDAMIAPEPDVSLLIKVADCQGVLLYDPVSRILGLAHSGWRGSVQNIIAATVVKMTRYGAVPQRMLAAVAPSLGPCCAEFVHHAKELPPRFTDHMVSENHFDFWAISREQLTGCGIRPANIEIAGICTKCSPEFFSYRGGDQWGRFGIMAGVSQEHFE